MPRASASPFVCAAVAEGRSVSVIGVRQQMRAGHAVVEPSQGGCAGCGLTWFAVRAADRAHWTEHGQTVVGAAHSRVTEHVVPLTTYVSLGLVQTVAGRLLRVDSEPGWLLCAHRSCVAPTEKW